MRTRSTSRSPVRVTPIPVPEVTVEGNGNNIADGDTTPDTSDLTDFGSVTQGQTAAIRTFTVTNDGDAPLTLSGLTVPTGFTITEGLSASLAAGASDTFSVQMETSTTGTKTGQISFTNNDDDENPFNFEITGTVTEIPVPEVTVEGNDNNIVDGDTTPDTSDFTDFGSVTEGETPVTRTFTVTNDGDAPLTLSGLVAPTGFTITEGLAASLAAGASDTFSVRMETTTLGTKTGQISFANNDDDENPFNFEITGTVTAIPVPEVTVEGNGTNITDGDTTPDASDFTDFGSVTEGDPPVTRTFTVTNDGDAPLTLSGLTVPTGFTITEGLAASLAAGESDTFSVRLETATTGTKTGQISFTNNDDDENPFNFQITGTVAAAPAPEVTVEGNTLDITDGDTTPDTSDFTDFGSVTVGDPPVTRTFTVTNDGDAPLTLSGLVVPTGFTVTEGLAASLAAGESDTFTVQLNTATIGTKTGQISFTNNDDDENPFNFEITGTVTAIPSPEVTVEGNGNNIADGDTTPDTSDFTDFGSVILGGTAVTRTFTVTNDGDAPLTLSGLTVPTGFTVTEGLSGSLAAGESDTFTVQLDTATTGTKTGQISFTNNDDDESPFNFEITGTVTANTSITTVSFQEGVDGYAGTTDAAIRGDFPFFNTGSGVLAAAGRSS